MATYQTTPLSVDLYSRVMASAFDEKAVVGVPTAFQAFFGRSETGAQTLYSPNANDVDIDIIRANERLAALVPRGTVSRKLGATQKNANAERFTNVNRVYPLIEEESDISANQILNRLAGENPYERRSRRERLRTLALREHQEQVRRTVRLFEYLAMQSIMTGTMPAILGTSDTDLIYDFYRNSTHSVTLATSWNDVGADILGDIDDQCDKIRANAHVTADMMLLGGNAMETFLKDTDVQNIADNRRFELIEVSDRNPVPARFSRFVDAGFEARGRLRTPRGRVIWMFTYNDVYTDSAGDATLYMDEDKVLICYSGARCDRYFGPPEMLPQIPQRRAMIRELFGFDMEMPPMPPNIKNAGQALNAGQFYFDAYAPEDWKRVTIRSQSAPIFVPVMTDAFVVIENAYAPA